MMIFVFFLLIAALVIFLMNPFVTFLHEIGHAIPALMFTKKGLIEVYIGSYADKNQTLKIKIGRISFFIKYNFRIFSLKGLCIAYEPITPTYQNIIFILGGITINLITAIVAFFMAYFFADNGLIKFVSAIFITYSFVVFIGNLYPRLITTKDGKSYKNDGLLFENILKQKKLIAHANKGDKFFREKNYLLALKEYRQCIRRGLDSFQISNTLADVYIQLKKYTEVEQLIAPKIENNTADFADYYHLSYVLIMKKDFDESIYLLKKALELEVDNQLAFNALGYCLTEIGDLKEAEYYLLKALEDELSKPFALNNLGYLKIITGKLEEGFLLVEQSIAIDATNGYAYRNRGIFYFKKGEFNLAKIDFEKAYNLETDILHLDVWMKEVSLKTA